MIGLAALVGAVRRRARDRPARRAQRRRCPWSASPGCSIAAGVWIGIGIVPGIPLAALTWLALGLVTVRA